MILQWSELIRLMLDELEVRGLSVSKSQSVGGGIQYNNAIGVLSEVVWFGVLNKPQHVDYSGGGLFCSFLLHGLKNGWIIFFLKKVGIKKRVDYF